MKTTNIHRKLLVLLLALGWAGISLAGDEGYPYNAPKQDGYLHKHDSKPWFDGKDYPFFRDMFDGNSIKPQEEGTYQEFPENSVPVRVVLGKVTKIYDPYVPFGAERDQRPKNPTEATPDSIARGKELYDTYCAVCHGVDGNAGTQVTQRGVPAPPIAAMLKIPNWDAHLYNKIKYGSFYQEPRGLMPAYGAQTSIQDRWDMVNYMQSPEFGK